MSRQVSPTWPICARRVLDSPSSSNPAYRDFLLRSGGPNRVFALTLARIWLAYCGRGAMRYGIFTFEEAGPHDDLHGLEQRLDGRRISDRSSFDARRVPSRGQFCLEQGVVESNRFEYSTHQRFPLVGRGRQDGLLLGDVEDGDRVAFDREEDSCVRARPEHADTGHPGQGMRVLSHERVAVPVGKVREPSLDPSDLIGAEGAQGLDRPRVW